MTGQERTPEVHAFPEECCKDLTLCGAKPLPGDYVNGFARDWTCPECVAIAEAGRR
ncbi:hypothetical protein GCM10009798_23320 [Nocardioides panacihumi]|uniref:DUF3039 domain-containing protein n=1 Tax=Nocardioides panacihumi TaxID=400774 RepID=A0ABN2R328_9ACTN